MESKVTAKPFKIEPLLGGLALLLLLIGCFFILKPFMTALMWAAILAYSLHPMQRSFTRWFRGSRTLAACFVTLTMTIILAGPIVLMGFSIAKDAKDLGTATRNWFMSAPEQAPPWMEKVPLVGKEMTDYWVKFAEFRNPLLKRFDEKMKAAPKAKIVGEENTDTPTAYEPVTPAGTTEEQALKVSDAIKAQDFAGLLGESLAWVIRRALSMTLSVGQGVVQLVLSGFLAFFLLRDASILSDRLAVAADRLAGVRGQRLIKVAGDTVRGVIYGILGTAIAQALVAGLGFWIAGVPGAVLLSVLTFFFAVVPFGPPMIWLPASLWLFAQDKPGLGIFMLLWGGLGISMVDNFLRPYLISQGSKMPFVLIFCGVIGGALAFGLVGVFMGPTMLAVAFRVVEEWSSHRSEPEIDEAVAATSELRNEAVSDTPKHGGESLGVR